MVNKKFCLGMLIIVLVFGMTVIGCKDDPINEPANDPALIGTWVTKHSLAGSSNVPSYNEEEGVWEYEELEWLLEWEERIKFDGSNFEMSDNYPSYDATEKGTYTTNAGVITLTVTQINGDFFDERYGVHLESKWYSESELKDMEYTTNKKLAEFIVETFTPWAGKYSIDNNKLTFGLRIWTKKD